MFKNTILFASLILASALALANSEEVISNPGGGAPYLIVLEGNGPSTREPGIYRKLASGQWDLVAQGKVMILDHVGSTIIPLDVAAISKRADAAAVVNGKLIVFSTDSTPPLVFSGESKETSIEVLAPPRNSVVSLPAINEAGEFAHIQKLFSVHGKQYQVLLSSIRQAHPLGTGVTFSAVFEIQQAGGVSKLVPHIAPHILDWEFIDSISLSKRLFTANNIVGFISHGLAKQYATPSSNFEHPVLVAWRETISSFLRTPGSYTSKPAPVPYIDIIGNKVKIDSLPAISGVSNPNQIHVVYDPKFERSGIYQLPQNHVSLDEIKAVHPIVPGEIVASGGSIEMKMDAITSFNGTLLLVRDRNHNTTLILLNSEKLMIPVPLKTTSSGAAIKDISLHVPRSSKIALVSWQFADGKAETQAYDLRSKGNDLNIIANVVISKNFFSSEELALRTQYAEVGKKGLHFFDAETPRVDSEQEYKQRHKLSAVHVDITESLETEKIIEYYPKPASEKLLVNKVMYNQFETTPGKAKRTGIYLSNNKEPEIVAEILPPPPGETNEEDKEFIFDKKVLTEFRKNFDMGLVLTDESFQKGKKGFQLDLVISSVDTLPVATKVTEFLTANTNVEAIKTLAIKGEQTDYLSYLVFYKLKEQPLQAQNIRISYSPDKKSFIVDPGKVMPVMAEDIPFAMSDVEAKVKVGKNGTLYWVKTPHVQFSDPSFRLLDLDSGQTIDPKRHTLELFSPNRKDSVTSVGASWRYWGISSKLKDKNGKDKDREFGAPNSPLVNQESTSQFKTDIFFELRKTLEDLSDPTKPPRKVVLLVPSEIRDYALGYPLALFNRANDKSRVWAKGLENLKLYIVDSNSVKQNDVLQNLEALRETAKDAKQKPVLLGSLNQVVESPHPSIEGGKNAFYITERTMNDAMDKNSPENGTNMVEPHFLYMLTTEGKHIDVDQFNINRDLLKPTFSSLFIGTEREWKEAIASDSMEGMMGLDQTFEIVKLDAPTPEVRQKFVEELLARREIASLNYKVDNTSFLSSQGEVSEAEARKIMARYFVNRVDLLAHENKQSQFVGFMRAINSFSQELQKNVTFRNKKVIDRSAVEQVLSRVFPMVLNLDVLPEKDPLKRLSHKNAAWQWQQAGYGGPLKLKKDVIKVILSQLSPDSARSSSSSFIVGGESGSGKTSLFRSLFGSYLGLKEYNPFGTKESNQDAWYYIVKADEIKENNASENSLPSAIRLDDAMEHIDKFLESANGHRGFIIFDDLHLAPPKVRTVLLQKIRSILEKPTVQLSEWEIPTRNITIGVTLNFTNPQITEKIAKNKGNPTIEEKILGSLSTPDNIYDDSLLKRFGTVINLDIHPKDAKAPQLKKALGDASKNTFNNNRVLNFVSSDTINNLTAQFPNVDARIFTTSAIQQLIQLNQNRGHLMIVTPKLYSVDGSMPGMQPLTDIGSPTETPVKIQNFVETYTETVPIDKTVRGRIEFLRYLSDAIRKFTFETFMRSLNEHPNFAGNLMTQQALGAPSARALYDHMATIPYLPLKELNLDPTKLDVRTNEEKQQYRRIFNALLTQQINQSLAMQKVGVPPVANIYKEFTSGMGGPENLRTRQHVLREHMERLTPIIAKIAADLLRVKQLSQFPDSASWVNSLERKDPNLLKEHGEALIKELSEYIVAMGNKDLLESQAEQKKQPSERMTQYDSVRLFGMAVDRAVASLPWEEMTQFMVRNLSHATKNLSEGHNSNLQFYLFESKYSALNSIDASLVVGHAESMPMFEKMGMPEPAALHRTFKERCGTLLARTLELGQ